MTAQEGATTTFEGRHGLAPVLYEQDQMQKQTKKEVARYQDAYNYGLERLVILSACWAIYTQSLSMLIFGDMP